MFTAFTRVAVYLKTEDKFPTFIETLKKKQRKWEMFMKLIRTVNKTCEKCCYNECFYVGKHHKRIAIERRLEISSLNHSSSFVMLMFLRASQGIWTSQSDKHLTSSFESLESFLPSHQKEWMNANLVRRDDEFEVEQIVLIREHDLTRLWEVELIDVWHRKRTAWPSHSHTHLHS